MLTPHSPTLAGMCNIHLITLLWARKTSKKARARRPSSEGI